MPIGILFWGLFIIWLIFGGFWWRNGAGWPVSCRAATAVPIARPQNAWRAWARTAAGA